MNNSTVKANLATIELGDIKLDVYQMMDGSYRLSQSQISEALGLNKNYISRLQSSTPNQFKALQDMGFTGYTISVKTEGSKTRSLTLSLEDCKFVFVYQAKEQNNALAINILGAAFIESIERRADNAFDVIVDEIERNSRFKARMEGKATRRAWTDAVDDYLYRHMDDGRCSYNYCKFVYSNCTNYLYRKVLGHSARNAKILFQIEQTDNLRDQLSERVLKELDHIENLAMRYVDEDDLEPLAAMKLACDVGKVKYIGLSD